MLENLDIIIPFFRKWIMFPSFILAFLGGFIYKFSDSFGFIKNKKKTGLILITSTALIWIFGFAMTSFFHNKVQEELMQFLDKPSLKLYIDKIELDRTKTELILSELTKIDKHSLNHPRDFKEKEFLIISKDDDFKLRIVQIFNDNEEFMIFSDKYNLTTDSFFGQIKSSTLKELYKK